MLLSVTMVTERASDRHYPSNTKVMACDTIETSINKLVTSQ